MENMTELEKVQYSRARAREIFDEHKKHPTPLAIDKNGTKVGHFPLNSGSKVSFDPNRNYDGYLLFTGEANNLTVIDFDVPKDDSVKSGVEFWKMHILLFNKTLMVRSRSGGVHVYFQYQEGLTTSSKVCHMKKDGKIIPIAVDIRNKGGKIFGPGTRCYEYDENGTVKMPESSFQRLKNIKMTKPTEFPSNNFNETFYVIGKDLPIAKMPPELFEMLKNGLFDEDFMPIEREEEPKVGKKIEKKIENSSDVAKKLIKKLEIFDEKLWCGYDFWREMGMIIKNLTGDINIWKKFSSLDPRYEKEKYEIECENKWETFKEDKIEKIGWGRLNLRLKELAPKKYEQYLGKPLKEIPDDLLTKVIRFSELNTKWEEIQKELKKAKREEDQEKKAELLEDSIKMMNSFYLEYMPYILIVNEGSEILFYLQDEKAKAVSDGNNKSIINYSEWLILTKKELYEKFLYSKSINFEYMTKIDNTVCSPSLDLIINQNERRFFNMYNKPENNIKTLEDFELKNPNFNPEIKEKVHNWLEFHIKSVFCNDDEEDYLYLCRYVALSLFDLDFFPEQFVVLRSNITGTGKSSFVEKVFKNYMGRAFGLKGNSNFAGNGQLNSIVGKTFCMIEELEISNLENYNVFKQLISQKTISVELKYKNIREYHNNCKFIATTNATRPIKCREVNERRVKEFYIYRDMEKEQKGYFDILEYDWQYFTSFFLKFKDFKDFNKVYRKYETQTNKKNESHLVDSYKKYVLEHILSNYFGLEFIKDGKHYITAKESIANFQSCGGQLTGNDKAEKLMTKLFEMGILKSKDNVGRLRFGNQRATVFELLPYEHIAKKYENLMKNWKFCPCKNRASHLDDDDNLYCRKCKGFNETLEEIEY